MKSLLTRAYQMFLRSTRKRQIFLIVWLTHALFLCLLFTDYFFTKPRSIGRPIAVRTLQEAPKIIEKPEKVKSAAPKPQKQVAARPQKKPAAKPVSKPAPKSLEVQKQAFDDIKSALSELKQLGEKSESALSIPSKLHLVSAEKEISLSGSYQEHLISYLQETLDLPEYGAVKIKLRIDREGKLLESEIISSENRKNSDFLKNRLPELSFPCFNGFDIVENARTFTISFRNAEI